MIDVSVRFLSYIRDETGLDEVQVSLAEGSTVKELIENLRSNYGDQLIHFLIHKESGKSICLFMKDNQIVDLTEKLQHRDNIVVMPSVGGG